MMPTWWVMDVLQNQGPQVLLAWTVWIVVSISLHELAHGYAAVRLGDSTPYDSGHMTWNPLVHMGTMGVLLFVCIGCSCGSMPVSPHRLRGRYAEAWVAVAGPLMNLGIFVICVLLAAVFLRLGATGVMDDKRSDLAFEFFALGARLNMMLVLFNLLPVPPLDGWRIAGTFYRPYARVMDTANGPLVSMTGLIIAFVILWPPLRSFGNEVTFQSMKVTVRAVVPAQTTP